MADVTAQRSQAAAASADADQHSTMTTAHRIRSILGGSIGNAVEWYDFYVYSFFSLYFAKSFFPGSDQTAQLLNTAGIFALGFLMRPVGGLLMGWYADKHGRKAALTVSVLLMCFGSLLIAVTPTYSSIGIAAPVVLLLARMLQGISVGGEYGTSATYLSEMATSKHRGFYSSFQYVTLISGQLLASLVLIVLQQVFLTHAEIEAWGWRIPFFIGAACAVIAFYFRRGIEETESFTRAKKKKAAQGSFKALLQHPREVLTVVGLTMGGTTAFYTYTTYMQKFLVNTSKLDAKDASLISTATLFIFMLLQPLVGYISDKTGRRPVLIAFGILGTLATVPILSTLADTHTFWGAFTLVMAALVIVSGYTSINAVVKAELFPAEIRALGVGLPYAITVALFGGWVEFFALKFKDEGHENYFFYYVSACILASLLVYAFMRDTKHHSRIDRDHHD